MSELQTGDKLRFPDGTEWVFIRYLDDIAIVVSLGEIAKVRGICKCCTPKLADYRIKTTD